MKTMKTIYLAGGCFWGTEKYFSLIPGVVDTKVGYANGLTEKPTYEQVCRDHTGHAETVKVTYDESLISIEELLDLYYEVIDPTSVNRQGGDTGVQYRTGIYYEDLHDYEKIKKSLEDLQKKYTVPIAIENQPLEQFYSAEEYHQKYLDKNPSGYCHIGEALFNKAQNYKK